LGANLFFTGRFGIIEVREREELFRLRMVRSILERKKKWAAGKK
jgi:hypothetical protein